MPELPEVETVKNSLKKHLLNRTITSVEIIYPQMILTPLNEFINAFNNTKIIDISRKGKFLIFFLDNEKVLISHLRMEGKYYYFNENDTNSKHARIIFHLNNNEKVIYDDSRKFGIMEIHNKNDYLNAPCLSKLGLEPFDADKNYLYQRIHSLKTEIKSTLIDQTILSGIGNIYADEILFSSKINPFRKANTITLDECETIINQARRILTIAINEGGSTVSSYHPENGVDGKFQLLLNAYGRNNQPCKQCSTKMLKSTIKGRGTVYCPKCQKVAISVGIYGKIASGKSTILKYFASKNFKTFSSDDYIKQLYSKIETKQFLINIFSSQVLNDNGTINKTFIKNKIQENNLYKTKLEDYFHPLVKQAIKEFINTNKEEKLIFIEVPLMFESKTNILLDYIIGVDADISMQLQNLSIRGSKTPNLDLQINNTNQFDKYASKCDYIIKNNGSKEELFNKCDKIINSILSN